MRDNAWKKDIIGFVFVLLIILACALGSRTAFGAPINLKCGTCTTIRNQKVCAPACPKACPICPTCKPCATPPPTPKPVTTPAPAPAPIPTQPPAAGLKYWDYNILVFGADGKPKSTSQGWVDGLPDYNTPNHCTTANTVKAGESLQAKLNFSLPGQYVCAETSVWTINAQLMGKKGVHLINAPNHKPVIEPGYCTGCSVRTNTGQEGFEISGFEIRHGHNGLDFHSGNVTARNNWVHDMTYTSSLLVSSSYGLFEGNRFEDNGKNCVGWPNPYDGTNISPRHCHDHYNSNYKGSATPGYCANMVGVILRENYFGPTPGNGVNFNGNDCGKIGYYMEGTLIESNLFEDTNGGISFWWGVRNPVVRNNHFRIQNPPPSDITPSMKCAIQAWDVVISQAMIDSNSYDMKSDYVKYCPH